MITKRRKANSLFITGVIIVLSLILIFTLASFAEEVNNEDQEEAFEAHKQYIRIHFNDDDMDFSFQWILGSTHNGGCEIGEAFYAACQMEDGNPRSWEKEWLALAERVEKRAETSLEEGHNLSASEAFQKAANYYRAVLITMYPLDPQFEEIGQKSRECFKKAGNLSEPKVEYFEIPFKDTVLPGYFVKGNPSGEPCKTLIMMGGGETFCEDLYNYIAPEALKRGYNFVTADVPGQGILPCEGYCFSAEAEIPIKAILDYTLERPEVDPDKVAMFGISGGGYMVPRTATVDDRIKAVVVNSAVVDAYKLFAFMDLADMTDEEIGAWNPFKLATNNVIAWRWGLEPSNIQGLVEANSGYNFDPAKVTCPALAICGEGEYENEEVKRQQEEFISGVSNPNKMLVITPKNEGASSHCLGENRSLMAGVVFNWLDEIFD